MTKTIAILGTLDTKAEAVVSVFDDAMKAQKV